VLHRISKTYRLDYINFYSVTFIHISVIKQTIVFC